MNYVDALLKFEFYIPEELELGAIFVNVLPFDQIELWLLEELPEDVDKFYEEHGAPVTFIIVDNNDLKLAEGDEIAWLDADEDSDLLEELSILDLTEIFMKHKGEIRIAVTDSDEVLIHEEKVIISHKLWKDDD